jgi:hypothetical protein
LDFDHQNALAHVASRARSEVFLVGLGYHGCGCASLIDNSFA